MNDKTKYLVIVLGVFVAGFLFAFSINPGQVEAGTTKVKTLHDGTALLKNSDSGPPASLEIPEGVALTDVFISRKNASFNDCALDIVGFDPNTRGEESFRLIVIDEQDGYAEMHLESGLRSSAERPIVLRNFPGNCWVHVFWTGHE